MKRHVPGVSSVLVGLAFLVLPALASADTIGPITFEPATYSVGNINGQDGWIKTGPFDVAVSSTNIPGGFGTQSLQISNAVTSGSFGDQTFSKPLTNEAGETSAVSDGLSSGTRQNHFETQWDFTSASSTYQPGLAVVASPDRGDGARMSWIQMADKPNGLEVDFYDYAVGNAVDTGPCGCAPFRYSVIAQGLSRSTIHTIKVTMDFVDGVQNDVVKVYIDGSLAHIGTSWEDYFRNEESNPTRTVDSVLFRVGGTAAPITAGYGFLIDNLTLMSGASASVPSATTVVVHPADLDPNGPSPAAVATDGLNKWFFYNDENDTVDNTLGSFVTGPGTPPLGTGSAQISVTGTQRRNLATYQFGGTKLGDITTLKFSTYNPSAGNGGSVNRSAYLNFNVDFTGNSSTWQRRIVFVPNQNGTVTQDAWKEWDAIQGGNAKYNYSGTTWPNTSTGPDAGLINVPGTTLRTWNDLLADYPGIRVLVGDSWLGLRVGEPYADGYTENIDKFVLGTAAQTTQWDFDPAAAPTTAKVTIVKYVDGVPATAVGTNNTSFSMSSSWNAANLGGAGTGNYTLDPGNSYQAVTSDMDIGSSYTTSENLATSCTGANAYALAGYSTGTSLVDAGAAATSTDTPNFSNLTTDEYVVVRNITCPPTATYKVHILKYLDGAKATAVSANNYQFPMTATWSAPNIGAGGPASYVLGTNFGGAADLYGADTAAMTGPYDYITSEITSDLNATSQVAPSIAQCSAGKYYLDGYSTASTNFTDAAAAATSSAPVAFTGVSADQYVIVWNKTCPTKGSLIIQKNTIGGNGTFKFTGDMGNFQITTSGNVNGGSGSSQTFTNLTPGTYHITELSQSGWTMGDNECANVTVAAGQPTICTVTNSKNPKLGEIRGYKYEDWDGDGKPFETKWEIGLSGWTIYLDTNDNGVLDGSEPSTVTDSHGAYHFSGLVAGTYHVREVQKSGWISTYPSATPSSDKYDINLAAGQVAKNKSFGNFKLGSISGMKFEDKNGNGKKDNNESGLQGWTIKLAKAGGPTVTTTTDANGKYTFPNLGPGVYKVTEVQQAGWVQKTSTPSPIKIVSAKDAKNKDFGNKKK